MLLPNQGSAPPPPRPSSMSSSAERFINLGSSPTQKPLRVVGRLRTGESESASGTMGRGKSGRKAPAFSFFPSSIARSLFLLLFFFLLFIFFYSAIFIRIPSGSLCEGRPHYSARSILFGSFASDKSPNVLTEKAWENATH